MTTKATPEQVKYCKDLFRKAKLYYRCLRTDEELCDAVFKRTGFDLDDLTAEEAGAIIAKLRPEVKRQREL